MKIILIVLVILILAGIAVWGFRFNETIKVSRKLIHSATPFQQRSDDHSKTFLIVGDSTAVGIGASTPEESLAGRVSAYEHMTYTENQAVSGAVVANLPAQIAKAALPQYDLILVQIGGNDIIQFHDPKKSAQQLTAALTLLPPAKKVVVISVGDVGAAPLFPPPVTWIYTALNKSMNEKFTEAVSASGINAQFINFTPSPATQLIRNDPKKYLAADGLHPSSAGYALWFNDVKSALP